MQQVLHVYIVCARKLYMGTAATLQHIYGQVFKMIQHYADFESVNLLVYVPYLMC